MVLELVFGPDPQRLAARPAYRQRLAELRVQGKLVMAGPWCDESGALLVFRTDESGVREILSADPYYTTPGVTVTSVRQWQPIIGASEERGW